MLSVLKYSSTKFNYYRSYKFSMCCIWGGDLLWSLILTHRKNGTCDQGNQRPWLLPRCWDFSEIFTQQPEPVGRWLFGFRICRRRKIFGIRGLRSRPGPLVTTRPSGRDQSSPDPSCPGMGWMGGWGYDHNGLIARPKGAPKVGMVLRPNRSA
jgi:hypothetical protein